MSYHAAPIGGADPVAALPSGEARPLPAHAASAMPGPQFPDLDTSVRKGLDYLLSPGVRQTLPVYGLPEMYDFVWPWYVGQVPNESYQNMPGVICSDILQTGMALNDAGVKAEGLKTVDSYIVPVYSPGGPLASSRPYANDVLALVQAWQTTSNCGYRDLAEDLALRTTAAFSPEAYANRMIVNRFSMAGWDAAAYIIAFYMAGYEAGNAGLTSWADDMASAMVARAGDWEHVVSGTNTLSTWSYDYTALSYGHMMKALMLVDGPGYAAKIAAMKASLMAWQDADGWWPVWYGVGPNPKAYDDVQATAHVLEALNVEGDSATMYARAKASLFLRSSAIQRASGAFADNGTSTIYPEICGEALMALAGTPARERDVVTVDPLNHNGWSWDVSQKGPVASGHEARIEFVDGPGTPPLGTGSVKLCSSVSETGGKAYFHTGLYDGKLLRDLTVLEYSSYRVTTVSANLAPYLNVAVDVTGEGDADTLLIFEPLYASTSFGGGGTQAPPATGVWQTWNTLGKCGWSNNKDVVGFPEWGSWYSLEKFLDAYPNARIANTQGAANVDGFTVVVGDSSSLFWTSFEACVDNIAIGFADAVADTAYDCEPIHYQVTGIDYTGVTEWLMPNGASTMSVTLEAQVAYTPPAAPGDVFSVEFAVNGTVVGTAPTDATGKASLVCSLGAGLHSATCSAGGYSDTAQLVVRDVTGIAYTGQLLWTVPTGSISAPVELEGTLAVSPATASGAGFAVDFYVNGGKVGTALTNSSRKAGLAWSLGVGTYQVKCAYESADGEKFEDSAFLVVFNPSDSSSVNGGGWIPGVFGNADFGFSAKYDKNGVLNGTFSYSDGVVQFDKAPIAWLVVVDAQNASFGGSGWSVKIKDLGEPGRGQDYLELNAGAYSNGGTLGAGNIQIHKK